MSCCPHHTQHQNHPVHKSTSHQGEEGAAQNYLRRFLTVTFLLIPLALLTPTALKFLGLPDFVLRKYLQLGVASVIFYFSLVFFEHARHEIKNRQFGMMTLVSLAVGAGFTFSAASIFLPQLETEFYLEISTLIWVLLFGHYLEARSSAAAGDALSEVAKLLPQTAHLKEGEAIYDINVSELSEGQMALVKPGEKIPADGIIIKGKANLDESLISGESKPVEKGEASGVVAGSICLDGSLEIQITRVGENSTLGQIQNLIAQAQKTKPRMQKIADQAAFILTLGALLVALATILVWTIIAAKPLIFAITLAITVLVIACPHALGLAIPTVTTIATSLAIKNGVFIKDLGKLEVIKDVDYVVFDKTGTLTKGEFGVTKIMKIKNQKPASPADRSKLDEDQRQILKLAASLEQHSSHVIGKAVVKYAQEQGVKLLEVTDFKNLAGQGILGKIGNALYAVGNESLMQGLQVRIASAQRSGKKLSEQGKTVIFVAQDSKLLGALVLADQIKNESLNAIQGLHQLGIKVAMLTGDNEGVAKTVAQELNIDTYFAQVLPENKYEYIKNLQDQGNKVMMAGDGINDAPSLTQSDVGVAIGAGTDVAVEAGDVILTRNNPEDIVRLVILAKKVYRKMVENLIWATGYNVVAIPAAAGFFAPFGFFLKPAIGAILMSLSSIIVVMNALTLKRTNLAL